MQGKDKKIIHFVIEKWQKTSILFNLACKNYKYIQKYRHIPKSPHSNKKMLWGLLSSIRHLSHSYKEKGKTGKINQDGRENR